ncbi:MAG: hypothetical protein EOO11_11070 [Chitinophagaceae bacterium]|nr:MAG: hypothetical protein EOO11_11070 [Chitinophagaceae bacterium]
MSGLEFQRALETDPLLRGKGVPFILISSTATDDGARSVSDSKGTYVCVSGGVPELQADGSISKAAVSAAKAAARSYSAALKYLFRGDGTFADLSCGDEYAADPKYNGTYRIENGNVNMYSGGMLFYTFRPARNEENKVSLIQVHEAKDRYKAQFCQLVKQ